jgi:CheY-like chemotaxis protein
MPPTPPATILVAEDDSLQREMYSDLLSQAGYTVLSASNGEEALALVRAHRVDVALIDVTMPDMSGWNVVRQIRDDLTFDTLRIIVVTGLAEAWDRDASLAAGADSHLSKPVSPAQLLSEITRVLNK